MNINILFYSGNTRKNQIIKAVEKLNEIQTYFKYTLEECKNMDVCKETLIDWDKFSENY